MNCVSYLLASSALTELSESCAAGGDDLQSELRNSLMAVQNGDDYAFVKFMELTRDKFSFRLAKKEKIPVDHAYEIIDETYGELHTYLQRHPQEFIENPEALFQHLVKHQHIDWLRREERFNRSVNVSSLDFSDGDGRQFSEDEQYRQQTNEEMLAAQEQLSSSVGRVPDTLHRLLLATEVSSLTQDAVAQQVGFGFRWMSRELPVARAELARVMRGEQPQGALYPRPLLVREKASFAWEAHNPFLTKGSDEPELAKPPENPIGVEIEEALGVLRNESFLRYRIFKMRFVDGFSEKEIAKRENMKTFQVRNALSEMLEKLKIGLGKPQLTVTRLKLEKGELFIRDHMVRSPENRTLEIFKQSQDKSPESLLRIAGDLTTESHIMFPTLSLVNGGGRPSFPKKERWFHKNPRKAEHFLSLVDARKILSIYPPEEREIMEMRLRYGWSTEFLALYSGYDKDSVNVTINMGLRTISKHTGKKVSFKNLAIVENKKGATLSILDTKKLAEDVAVAPSRWNKVKVSLPEFIKRYRSRTWQDEHAANSIARSLADLPEFQWERVVWVDAEGKKVKKRDGWWQASVSSTPARFTFVEFTTQIQDFSPEEQKLLKMRFSRRWSTSFVAQVMGVSEKKIQNAIHRLLGRIEKNLGVQVRARDIVLSFEKPKVEVDADTVFAEMRTKGVISPDEVLKIVERVAGVKGVPWRKVRLIGRSDRLAGFKTWNFETEKDSPHFVSRRQFDEALSKERNTKVRTAMEMKYIHGWSGVFIAQYLGVNKDGLGYLVDRGLRRISIELGEPKVSAANLVVKDNQVRWEEWVEALRSNGFTREQADKLLLETKGIDGRVEDVTFVDGKGKPVFGKDESPTIPLPKDPQNLTYADFETTLAKLDEFDQLVMRLRYEQRWSPAFIRLATGKSRSTVESSLARIAHRIKKDFPKKDYAIARVVVGKKSDERIKMQRKGVGPSPPLTKVRENVATLGTTNPKELFGRRLPIMLVDDAGESLLQGKETVFSTTIVKNPKLVHRTVFYSSLEKLDQVAQDAMRMRFEEGWSRKAISLILDVPEKEVWKALGRGIHRIQKDTGKREITAKTLQLVGEREAVNRAMSLSELQRRVKEVGTTDPSVLFEGNKIEQLTGIQGEDLLKGKETVFSTTVVKNPRLVHRTIFYSSLEKLDQVAQDAMRMRFEEGWSRKAISLILDVPENEVSKALGRGIHRIQKDTGKREITAKTLQLVGEREAVNRAMSLSELQRRVKEVGTTDPSVLFEGNKIEQLTGAHGEDLLKGKEAVFSTTQVRNRQRVTRRTYLASMAKLDQLSQDVMRMRFEEGWSRKAISLILDVPEKEVSKALGRGIHRLQVDRGRKEITAKTLAIDPK